jgi:GH25 family lysozyme M1 (1,4-beta-N-acetylmuramidase)
VYQTITSWTSVAASGIQFAFIRSSYGSGPPADTRYAAHRAGAKAAGLKVGAYHFAYPNCTIPHYANDPVAAGAAEADWFMTAANPQIGELLPVLDIEGGGLNSVTSCPHAVTVSEAQQFVRAFYNEVFYKTGLRTIIYTSPSTWSSGLGNWTVPAAAGEPLWLAHWYTANPIVPASNWGGKGWIFWQHTDLGSVPGISGRVDRDRFNSKAAIADFSAVTITSITPQPRPSPSAAPSASASVAPSVAPSLAPSVGP